MSAKLLATSIFKPDKAAVVFAIKGVIAMAASLYIAMYCNLERPYWALVSAVFLQIRPESGLVIEKGFCQIIGTLIGGIVGILILEFFIPYPALAFFFLSLWIGLNAYLSAMVRRTNFIYAYAMAGITAVLVVVLVMVQPTTASSATIFDVAQARVSELIVGSLCATVISQLFWPVKVKDGLQLHARKVINDCLEYLSLEISDSGTHESRHNKIDAIFDSLTILTDDSSAVSYEGPRGPGISRAAVLLCNKIMSLLAVIQIFGRLKRNHPELMTSTIITMIGEMQSSFDRLKESSSYDDCYHIAQELRRTLLRHKNNHVASSALETRLIKVAMEVAAELVLILKSFNAINEQGDILLNAKNFKPYKNPMIALSVAVRTTTSFLVGVGLWIGTGSNAVVMMMILPVIFSIMMARLPLMIVSVVLKRIVIGSVVASFVAIFYALNLLAQSSGDFPILVMVLAGPYFLGLLALAVRPTLPYGLGFCIPFTILVRPASDMSYSFQIDSTVSNAMSIAVGVTVLYWLFQLITSPSVKSIQKDLIAETVRDLKRVSNQNNAVDWFNARMGDRVLRIVAFDKAKPTADRIMTDIALTGLNLGHILIRVNSVFRSLETDSNAKEAWNKWVKALSRAYSESASGLDCIEFGQANEAFLNYLKENRISSENYEMFKGMCERITLTFKRIAASVVHQKDAHL
ncbi:FUSC family protein [Vibrio viridaestus]|uniref:FUSC family protein n=1 Tax=Vibrio viridaestus TaxID=2487322 RepID=A0A3N9THM3_9VIBR|nr:FUSC family protein [Vibrio viridaestus]RQW63669.1 FUSC family protein [Vibrio viridaestus]